MINDGLLDDEKDVYFDDKDLKTFLVLRSTYCGQETKQSIRRH